MSCTFHNRINYVEGQAIGACLFLREMPHRLSNSGRRIRMGLFKCPLPDCGNEFISPISTVKTGDTVSCGCYGRSQRLNATKKHGMKNHWLYPTWYNMRRRCRWQGHVNYCDYGGRGITVCDEWYDDFMVFYNYVSKLPNYGEDGMTLDRIDNNGNYEPVNIRWATQHQQVINSRSRKGTTSKYKGVSFDQKAKKWKSNIYISGKHVFLGCHPTEEEAAAARDAYITQNKLPDFPIQTGYSDK